MNVVKYISGIMGGSRGSSPLFCPRCIGFLTLGLTYIGPPPGPPFLLVNLRWTPPPFKKSWIRPCRIKVYLHHLADWIITAVFSVYTEVYPPPLSHLTAASSPKADHQRHPAGRTKRHYCAPSPRNEINIIVRAGSTMRGLPSWGTPSPVSRAGVK